MNKLFICCGVITGIGLGMALGVADPPKAETYRVNVSYLGGLLLDDGAQASLCADWILKLKPGIDPALAYNMAHSVARWSRNYGVDPKTVVAIIWIESEFTPSCQSATNDSGLMQLHNRPIYGVDENIRAGCEHYSGNLRDAHGDEFGGLTRYNGSRKYARQVLAIREGLR